MVTLAAVGCLSQKRSWGNALRIARMVWLGNPHEELRFNSLKGLEMKIGGYFGMLLPVLWFLALPAVQAQDYEYTISEGAVTVTAYIGAGGAVSIPATIESLPVTTIGNKAFYSKSTLTSVTIPNSVTIIGAQVFSYCDNLTSATIPNSVTAVGPYGFIGCTNLTSITIGNGVTTIESRMFSDCDSLVSVTIPDSVTSIEKAAFNFCISLTDVTIGNGATSI